MYNHRFVDWPYDKIPKWDLIGRPEYTDSVYQGGIRNAVLVATWKDDMFLIGGNRRILSLQAAHAKAELDGTLESRPWLNVLPVLIFDNVPPEVQKAWALADNEERSDNPLHAYLTIKAAQEAGDWDKVAELFRYNAQRLRQVMEFEKLTPELLEAVMVGRLTPNNALLASRLGARQRYVLELASKRGPNAKITIGDIKAAKTARATAVLQVLSDQVIPKENVNQTVDEVLFLVTDNETLANLREEGRLYSNFRKAFEEASAAGDKLYRLVEV